MLDGASGKVAFVQPGAGFRLFVRKLALPAVGLDITYSLEERSLWTAVSLGLKM